MSWVSALRFIRFALLISFLPFIRSCNDTGIVETFGFPLPFTEQTNHYYSFDNIYWLALCANIVFFIALAAVICKRYPNYFQHLISIRICVVLIILAFIFYFFNQLIFIPYLAVQLIVATLYTNQAGNWVVVDVLSRFMAAYIVSIIALIMSTSKTNLSTSKTTPINFHAP